ncbi:hypothetical protein HK101_002729 [Irineochytrium annulatum]|nr:hypothetical protein HK101_002729 [Irineochytrium annulatum]
MGCGASKTSEKAVKTTSLPPSKSGAADASASGGAAGEATSPPADPPSPTDSGHAAGPDEQPKADAVKPRETEATGDGKGKGKEPLDRTVIPDVSPLDAARGTHGPVAFEIPLGDDLFGSTESLEEEGSASTRPSAVLPPLASGDISGSGRALKVSLPKLDITDADLQAKLANTEARWKDLDEARQRNAPRHHRHHRRHHGATKKPQLSHHGRPPGTPAQSDPTALLLHLQEKERLAALNRERAAENRRLRLARENERIRRVLARKRWLVSAGGDGVDGASQAGGPAKCDGLNLSWGGEDGLEEILHEMEREDREDEERRSKKEALSYVPPMPARDAAFMMGVGMEGGGTGAAGGEEGWGRTSVVPSSTGTMKDMDEEVDELLFGLRKANGEEVEA